jgi:primosomal protein N' (replication factor Y)
VRELTARQRNLPHFEIPGRVYHITWRTHDKIALTPEARERTIQACRFWHGKKFKGFVACVMPDHVHLIIQPLPVHPEEPGTVHSLSEILHNIKSFSAKEVNKAMKRTGFVWNDESYDRMIRSESDLHETWNYVWNNPRVIGLVGPTEDYPFIWAPGLESDATHVRQDAEHDPRDAGATYPTTNASRTFLLYGVTGSGKTEVYLQAIAHCLQQKKGAIVLVPEISLTPQTVERFKARFCSGPLQTLVAVLHSHLSAGERHDEWHKIRQGRAKIVIGARSAIFAPVDPLGLIIVDEEHEHSYKQEEAPRYHARDVAVVRGQSEGAVAVLGSATPSLESFYNVQKGKYALLELRQRADDKKMPLVRVIDMRQEARKEKGTPIFSQKLKEEITRRLEHKEQVMLFLNRRGYATSLQCPKCGYVAECPNCSLALTYHRAKQKVCCHICGHEAPAPAVCPNEKCRNPAIRYAGLGTEKVEDALTKLFPHARVKRMDSDTLKRKEDYRRILGDFRIGKIDILVGTQMIAKGLHFPNVTLVGIIYADLSLHQPDFRAAERTFQLLTQVAGRAGRGDVEGEVVVQAFTPFHPAIQYARRHDFAGFYEQEIEFRQQLRYPPITRVALLTLKGRNEEKVRFSAEHLRKQLEEKLLDDSPPSRPADTLSPRGGEREGVRGAFKDIIIAGPAPAPLLRAETFYRYQLMLRTRQMSRLSQSLAGLMETLALPEDVSLTVDIDPVDLI